MIKKTGRRDFLKTGLATTAVMMTGGGAELFRPKNAFADALPDLVVSYGADPSANTRAAVEALGGMKRFVKPGNKVFIKPNMSFASGPERASNTNPQVVREVAMMCSQAGASRITILDNVLSNPKDCMALSKIPETCKDVPNIVVNYAKSDRLFREKNVSNGSQLKSIMALSDVLDADVLIAVPVGKTHSSAGVSLSMKGMMGLVRDRGVFHSRYDLHEAIVDLASVLKPQLVVVDGTRILSSGGPGGPGKVIPMNLVIASPDMVAADAEMVALGTWYDRKFSPNQVRHIRIAAERGLGRMDVDKLNVKTIKS